MTALKLVSCQELCGDDDYKPSLEAQLREARARAENAEEFARLQTRDRDQWVARIKAEAVELANETIQEALDSGATAPADDPFETPPVTESPFKIVEAGEFMAGDSSETEWAIQELVPTTGLGISYGQSRAFKSFAILDKAACIHRGVPWRDRPVRKGRAVIIVAEGASGFKKRMRAYAKHHGIAAADMPAVIPAAPNFFTDLKKLQPLVAALKAFGCTYLAIDNQTQVIPGADESSTKDMTIVYAAYTNLSRLVGCFVDVISHTGHGDQSHARGSSVQRPAVDVEVFHQREGQSLTASMTVRKLKDSEDGAEFTFKMRKVDLGAYDNGKPYGSLVLEHVANVPGSRVKLPAEGTDMRAAYDMALAGITEGKGRANMEAVAEKIAETKKEPDPGKDDRRLSRANDELKKLVRAGHLFREGGTLKLPAKIVEGESENF